MILMEELNLQNLLYSSLSEPGEIFVGQEVFLVFNENPQTELIYIRYFNL